MRVARVGVGGDVRHGIVEGDECVRLISSDPFSAFVPLETVPLRETSLLAPVAPTKIVCVGLNYRAHAEELGLPVPGEPVIFLKPPTATNPPRGAIVLPDGVSSVDHEAELAVVIGRRMRRVPPERAREHILGYTCANDVTAREIQHRDGQWTRSKSFDGFCPLGPWIETDLDPADIAIEAWVNGERRQAARTSDMVVSPHELASFVSFVMTLLPGDVVLTGTPAGVGPLVPGDTVEVRIEGIGTLVSSVA